MIEADGIAVRLCSAVGLHGQVSGEVDGGKSQVGEAVDRRTDAQQTAAARLRTQPTRYLTAACDNCRKLPKCTENYPKTKLPKTIPDPIHNPNPNFNL